MKVWEGKQIDDMTVAETELRRKYGLPNDLPFLATINKYHLIYVTKPQLNTTGFFLSKLDA